MADPNAMQNATRDEAVLSETLVQHLAAEGLFFDSNVIQRGINSRG
jgi:hypothetical protein